MNLSELIAKGVTAEGVVRAVGLQVDEDWQTYLDRANTASDPIANLVAVAKAEAIAPYRALLLSLLDTWDAQDAERTTPVIPVRPS